jgi:adenosylcobinamide kinase/adenosylcobinamide-phosphate guanylyltransferase
LGKTVFVIGGCRSGKSGHALNLAESMCREDRIFVATCTPGDDEMKQRVEKHQKERSATWKTVEEPLELSRTIDEWQEKAGIILVDCVEFWIANMMFRDKPDSQIEEGVIKLVESLNRSAKPVVLVSSEVGCGIVPENRLSRKFRDMVGFANQSIAKAADHVVWMVAGIPVTIKYA